MRTLGQRVVNMEPAQRLRGADRRRGATIYVATRLGFPLSTTHVISGAVMGAGATQAALRRALGRRREHRFRLAADDPCGGARRGGLLLAR